MTVTNAQNNSSQPSVSNLALAKAQAATQPEANGENSKPDALILAYMMIFHCVLVSNWTAEREAKELQNNAMVQNNLIMKEQGFNFVVCGTRTDLKDYMDAHMSEFPSCASWNIVENVNGQNVDVAHGKASWNKTAEMDVLNHVQEENQFTSALRSFFSNKLTIVRQTAQLSESDLNTAANNSSNSIQEGSSLMQLLTSLTSQISKI